MRIKHCPNAQSCSIRNKALQKSQQTGTANALALLPCTFTSATLEAQAIATYLNLIVDHSLSSLPSRAFLRSRFACDLLNFSFPPSSLLATVAAAAAGAGGGVGGAGAGAGARGAACGAVLLC